MKPLRPLTNIIRVFSIIFIVCLRENFGILENFDIDLDTGGIGGGGIGHTHLQLQQSPSLNHQQKLPERCEPITIPMCMDIQYNQTILPNILGHISQESAKGEIHQYLPLVKVNCSQHLQIFLCSIYVPVCNVLETPLKPCRSLCIQARTGCDTLMGQFGFNWPDSFDCNKFPEANNELCFGEQNNDDDQDNFDDHNNPNGQIDMKLDPWYNHPNSYNPNYHHNNYYHNQQYPNNINHQLSFKCPTNFLVPAGMDYVFRIQGNEHKDCGMPCDGLLFDTKERHLIRIWTGMWSIFCIISTLFTIFTFLLDSKRFEYPERAIIFLSICYLFIGLVFLFGFLADNSVACNQPFPQPPGHQNVQMIRTITQGNKNEKCTLLFMVLYFFLIANSIWWLILTISWFLFACLQWGNEFIESNSHYFHLFSWTIPAILTIIILAMNKVEGDILTGICFITQWNPKYMFIFVIAPIAILLIFGFIFLTSGFVSLLQIRTNMIKQMKKTNLKKFDKFMLKIGFFSILYLIPSSTLIMCLYYEQNNIDSFLLQWLQDVCSRFDYGIPCPNINNYNHHQNNNLNLNNRISPSNIQQQQQPQPMKPKLIIYLIKYLCFLMPGIISGFWIWSEKTVSTWNRIIKKFCCFISFGPSPSSSSSTTARSSTRSSLSEINHKHYHHNHHHMNNHDHHLHGHHGHNHHHHELNQNNHQQPPHQHHHLNSHPINVQQTQHLNQCDDYV